MSIETFNVYRVNDEDGSNGYSSSGDPDVVEAIINHVTNLRSSALEFAASRSENAGVEQIDAYFEGYGLRTAPEVILEPSEIPEFRTMFNALGCDTTSLGTLGTAQDKGTVAAMYLPQPDIIVGVNWPDDGHSSAYGQAIMAHEKAHSTSLYRNDIQYTDSNGSIGYSVSRVGHNLTAKSTGTFFEEGFAQLMATKYVREQLHMPYGEWATDYHRSIDDLPPVPPAYIWPRESGGGTMGTGSLASYGLELIARDSPELVSDLILARSSVLGLRGVARAVDEVRPGLYNRLNNLSETPQSFAAGLSEIQQSLSTVGYERMPGLAQ